MVHALRRILRSLKHRNFRLFFVGQSISMTGSWMQQTAQMWLVYQLTQSPLLLGLVGFVSQIPVLFLGLIGGAFSDHFSHNRRGILICTQSVALMLSLVLGLLTLSGRIRIWQIFALALAAGLLNSFDMPARQSFLADMVTPEDFANAIALNSLLINASRMVGPALAGVILGVQGGLRSIGTCFLLNAASFLGVLAGLALIRVEKPERPASERSGLPAVGAALSYASGIPAMRDILLLLALISHAGVPYMALLPIFAEDILRRGSYGLGLLTSATGVGALFGAVLLARRESHEGLFSHVGVCASLFGLGLVLFGLSRSFELSVALMVLVGFGMMNTFAGSNTLLQTITSDQMRGRVMSLFTMTFMGVAPIGTLIAGYAASLLGAPATLVLGGIACLASGAAFSARAARNYAAVG